LFPRSVSITAGLTIVGFWRRHGAAPSGRALSIDCGYGGSSQPNALLQSDSLYPFHSLFRGLCRRFLCCRIPRQTESAQTGRLFIRGAPPRTVFFHGRSGISRALVFGEYRAYLVSLTLGNSICHLVPEPPPARTHSIQSLLPQRLATLGASRHLSLRYSGYAAMAA